jgi:hypothetical protein
VGFLYTITGTLNIIDMTAMLPMLATAMLRQLQL